MLASTRFLIIYFFYFTKISDIWKGINLLTGIGVDFSNIALLGLVLDFGSIFTGKERFLLKTLIFFQFLVFLV